MCPYKFKCATFADSESDKDDDDKASDESESEVKLAPVDIVPDDPTFDKSAVIRSQTPPAVPESDHDDDEDFVPSVR